MSKSRIPSLIRQFTSAANPSIPAQSKAVADVLSEKKIYPADILSGVPPEISRRSVRIYQPARTATQQGMNKDEWKIDFDVQTRWENPLMGWASSGDPMQATHVKFNTKEEAVLFAERQGYDYWVEEPKQKVFKKKVYAENFTYVPGNLRLVRTK